MTSLESVADDASVPPALLVALSGCLLAVFIITVVSVALYISRRRRLLRHGDVTAGTPAAVVYISSIKQSMNQLLLFQLISRIPSVNDCFL